MSSSGSGLQTLAGRYAQAWFDLAVEQKALPAAETDAATLTAALDESEDLRRFVRSPLLSRADQGRALDALAAPLKLSPLTKNMLGVLTGNRRLFVLRDVVAALQALAAASRGETRAYVTAAQPLSDAQRKALRASLKASTGATVTLDEAVDPALLGGLVVKVGSRMMDGSLRSKLARLELAMKGTG